MYAELVINIEAALEGTFHYHIPADMGDRLQIGHLVEVEFGRRLAQGIVIDFAASAPVPDTKPIIGLIDETPVVLRWQIALARWLSQTYMAPLNACLRLMLPPGLTRWADITLDINPYWDGSGRLTDAQEALIDLLKARGFLRGRQIRRALPNVPWEDAANQLARRYILLKGSVLDPPRVRPRRVRTADLIAGPRRIWEAAKSLGRASKAADLLAYLVESEDPLPTEQRALGATGAGATHLRRLEREGLVARHPASTVLVPLVPASEAPAALQEALAALPAAVDGPLSVAQQALIEQSLAEEEHQPATLSACVSGREALTHLFRLRRGSVYERVLSELARAAQPLALSDLYAATDAKISHLRRLSAHDLIRLGALEVWRDPLADRDFVPAEAPELTPDQTQVWARIRAGMVPESVDDDPGSATDAPLPASLLHGVTGSGKTEIYMRAIDLTLQQGRQAVVLVPEIALTPQTVRRFAARFPGRVAVLHSRLSDGERFDTWRRARQGLFDIVIGPRSALFTPLPDIGVIVVDEEHDHSYKQSPPVPPPYYHARETAIAMGRFVSGTVILGSATPDIVTYHRARAGELHLLELPRRIMGHRQRVQSQEKRLHRASHYRRDRQDPENALTIPLPPVEIVDLRQELRSGNRSIFSRALHAAVDEALAREEQVILFLNRRGTATFVICRECGQVMTCPRCDVPYTYHRPHLQLICHHCGRREAVPQTCPQCGSRRIRYFGLGTEELEARVATAWPEARVVRWDRDTTAGKDRHEALLSSFINQEADILIGTQMIAKGLDLPLVTLVGVVSADVSLGLPDYRAGERTFQLLTQVAGRAGRGLLGGRVIVQTYKPENYAIQAAAEHDFVGFYLEEIRFRTQHGLPPFRRMARLVLADPVNQRAERQGAALASELKAAVRRLGLAATDVLGPTPAFFSRVDGRYRWHILIRAPNPLRLLEAVQVPAPWTVDVDPVSLL